ncbi:hypothetical protein MMC18_001120 [Xylographa bjoerkii]|nr:hypothetical protein [Xylographa bjoerkii]
MASKTILITGCSANGLGDALAREFHRLGHHVIATARNRSKLAHFKALGISTLELDVLSASSIAECVSAVSAEHGGSLDVLINNSGACYSMPLADASISEGQKLFDLNVWAVLAVTQAFLPLLLKSKHGALVANQTSISSVCPNPMAGVYNMSKAAAAMLTDTMRLELAPFNIKVVDLKTGAVKSNFFENQTCPSLPVGSIYMPAKAAVERAMAGEGVLPNMVDQKTWAKQVAGDLMVKKPAARIWRGGNAMLVWFARRCLPFTFLDGNLTKLGGLDVLKEKLASRRIGKSQ